MANFFSRFKKRWANSGVIAEPTDIQMDNGFNFLGNNPPSLELFNAIHQLLDEKDNWLYSQLAEVMSSAGVTPSSSDVQGLLKSLRGMAKPGLIILDSAGFAVYGNKFIVPANVYSVRVVCVGGGGGGGGAYGINGAASGGGGGGYAEAICSVTPGQVISIAVGAKGLGAIVNNPIGSTGGGTTSFGNFLSATGGGGGTAGFGFASTAGSAGIGYGAFAAPGVGGGLGQQYQQLGITGSYTTGGGLGGGAGNGVSSMSPLSIGASGNPGVFPGGGGTGGGMPATADSKSSTAGGDGGSGSLRIEWNI
jgi:hypothetical protein